MAEKIIVEYGVNNEGLVTGLDEIQNANKELETSAKKTGTSFNSLTAELKAMKRELAGLQPGSKQFEDLAKKAGEVQDKIGDISTRVKTLASDTRKLDTVIQAATGIAAGFSIAQGAMALFGSTSKDVEKALLKVQSAMAILNGLQEIQNLLQKQTAIGSKLAAAGQAVYATTTGVLTGKIGIATAAQAAWNTVMALNPIGLIVTAVALLVAGLAQLFTAETDEESAIKAVNVQRQIQNNLINENIQFINDEAEFKKKKNENELAQMKVNGATEDQLTKQKIQNTIDEQKANNDLIAETNRLIDSDAENLASMKKVGIKTTEQADAYKKLQDEILKNQKTVTLLGLANDSLDITYQSLFNSLGENTTETKAKTEADNKQAEALKKLNDSGSPGSIGRYNFLLGEAKTALDKIAPGTDAYAKQLDVVTQAQLNLNNAIADSGDLFSKLTANMESEFDLNKKKVDAELKLEKDKADQKLAIQKEQLELENELIASFNETNDTAKKEKDEQDAEDKKQQQEQSFETAVQIAQQTSDALRGISQIAFNVEKNNLDKQLKNKKISQEKYDKELKEIQTKQAKRDKALNIFNSIIATAAAVVKMLANPGGPAGVALSIAAGITGAIQTAVIASQPIPQFAKGVIDLKGKGTGTSDSIHAMLSKGESVITAEKTARYKSELTALHNGNFEQMIYKNHVLPAVMRVKVELQNQLQSMMVKATLDDSRIVKALAKNKPNEFNYNRLASLINTGSKNRGWA